MKKKRLNKVLSGICELFPLSVVVTDPECRLLWMNRAFTEMCGYEKSELLGKVPGDVLQGRDSDREVIAEMARAIKARRPCEVELINYHKNGSPYHVCIHLKPMFNDEGELEYFFAVEREVTREHEIEEGRNGYILTLYERLSQALDCPSPEPGQGSRN